MFLSMISSQIKEMLGFLFILFVFLLGYGVASEALRHPYNYFSSQTIVNIIYQPYFQIYGELFLDSGMYTSNMCFSCGVHVISMWCAGATHLVCM